MHQPLHSDSSCHSKGVPAATTKWSLLGAPPTELLPRLHGLGTPRAPGSPAHLHVAPPPGLCPRSSSPPTLPPGVSSPSLFWLEMHLDAGASRTYSSRSRLPQELHVWMCSYLCNRCASSQPISQSACTPAPAQPFFLQLFPSQRQETPLDRVLRPRMQSSPSPFSLTPHSLHSQPPGRSTFKMPISEA